MSTRAEPGWSVWCDFPSCSHQFEYGDYTIFGDGWDVDEVVTEADGLLSGDGKHFCRDHPVVWQSDLEPPDTTTPPAPPYLLIHDGDDTRDDGTVSLVEEVAA